MWRDFESTEIAGDDKVIDKNELVKNFLSDTHCKERSLTSSEDLSEFLRDIKEEITGKSGVYCIYNNKTREVLDIGESKDLHRRIREQLIGSKNKKDEIQRFTRLFFAVLKKEKGIKEKEYFASPKETREELVKFYQNIIFKSGNTLRVYSTGDDHIKAFVLEQALIQFFNKKSQCKYNYQV
jgi:hypothetical protein